MNDLEIASYLDRGMTAADRDRVEEHMVDCSECRQNVVAAEQLLVRLRRPRRFVAFGSLAAVAAAVLLVSVPQLRRQGQPIDRTTRESVASSTLAVYEPIGSAVKQPLRFIWAPAPDAISYRITVSSAEGTTVWSADIADTTAVLPASVSLEPDTRYIWFADAILSDGSTLTTGLRDLIVGKGTH